MKDYVTPSPKKPRKTKERLKKTNKTKDTISLLDILKSFRTYKQETSTTDIKPQKIEVIQRLPIDDHIESILSHIRSHRCTVIHGETGNLINTLLHLFHFYFRLWKIFSST